jgi:hypothetical protein
MKENMKDNVTELEHTGNARNSESGRVHSEQVKPDRERMGINRSIQTRYQGNKESERAELASAASGWEHDAEPNKQHSDAGSETFHRVQVEMQSWLRNDPGLGAVKESNMSRGAFAAKLKYQRKCTLHPPASASSTLPILNVGTIISVV